MGLVALLLEKEVKSLKKNLITAFLRHTIIIGLKSSLFLRDPS